MSAVAVAVPTAEPITILSHSREAVRVSVHATDPVSRAGIVGQLEQSAGLRISDQGAGAAIVVTDEVDEDTVREVRTLHRQGTRVVLVVAHPDDSGVLAAVEAGACGLLRRSEATPQRLAAAVKSALTGDGTLSPDLLGRLLRQMGDLQRHVLRPRGLSVTGMTDREIEVLRLVADGFSTSEIARQLAYSERTIKNVIQGVVTRFHLRNRSHAVAYALRQGLI